MEKRDTMMPFAFKEATKDKSKNIIKVIGGGGSNAVMNMYKQQGVHNVLFTGSVQNIM